MAIIPESEVFKSYPLPAAGSGGFQGELLGAASSGSIVNNNLPSISNKITEALPKFDLFSTGSLNSTSGIGASLPGFSSGLGAFSSENFGFASQSFSALSNGSFNSNSISSAFSSLGENWQSGLSSLPGGFSGSDLAGLLDSGNSGGGGGVSQFAVKLVSQFANDVVAFEIMPTISESHSVSYEDITIAHHPGTIAKYSHTASRTWSISNIILASRNSDEATQNQKTLNILRSWSQPFYGYGTEKTNPNELGAPPEVLTFTAYGDKNIGPINAVLENLSFEWPNDCDYLHTADGQPFPVLVHITLGLKEAWSPKEYSGFDLMAYKSGNMASAYNKGNVNTSAGGESVTAKEQNSLEQEQKISDMAPENIKSQADQITGGVSNASAKALGEIKQNVGPTAAAANMVSKSAQNLGLGKQSTVFSAVNKSVPNSPWNNSNAGSPLKDSVLNLGL